MTNETNKNEPQTAIAPPPRLAMTRRGFEPSSMDDAWRMAQALAASTLVPASYRNKPGSCLIAIDLALRLNSSWLMVMQHVYDVKGKLGMEAQFCIALINQSGLFTDPLEYEVIGKDPEKEDYQVRAYAKRRKTEKMLYGPWITWQLVKAEGWHKKEGSKWLTMPEQMFHYRAASWFANRFCPEVKNGMMTTDEADEIVHVESYEVQQAVTEEKIADDMGSEPVNVDMETGEISAIEPEPPTDEAVDALDAAAEEQMLRAKELKAKARQGKKAEPEPDQETAANFVCAKCERTFAEPGQKPGPSGAIYVCPHCGSLRIKALPGEGE